MRVTGSQMVSAARLFLPLPKCDFWRLGVFECRGVGRTLSADNARKEGAIK